MCDKLHKELERNDNIVTFDLDQLDRHRFYGKARTLMRRRKSATQLRLRLLYWTIASNRSKGNQGYAVLVASCRRSRSPRFCRCFLGWFHGCHDSQFPADDGRPRRWVLRRADRSSQPARPLARPFQRRPFPSPRWCTGPRLARPVFVFPQPCRVRPLATRLASCLLAGSGLRNLPAAAVDQGLWVRPEPRKISAVSQRGERVRGGGERRRAPSEKRKSRPPWPKNRLAAS